MKKLLTKLRISFRIDSDYFVKNGFFVFLNHFIQIFFNFILSIFLARYLTKVDFGKWQFVMALIGASYIFSLPGMNISIMQSVAKKETENVFSGIKWRLIGSLVGSIVILLSSFYPLFYHKDVSLTIILFLTALIFPFYSSYESIFSYFMAKKEFLTSLKLQSTLKFFSTTLAILFLAYGFNLIIILTSYLFSIALIQFLFYYFYVKKFQKIQVNNQNNKKSDSNNKQRFDSISKYGIQLSVLNIITLLPGYLDKILTPVLLGSEALANYAIAMTVPDFFNGLMKPMMILVFPKIADFSKEKIGAILKSKIKLIILLTLSSIILNILLSELIPFVFGQKYGDVVLMSSFMSLSLISLLVYPLVLSYVNINKMLKSIGLMNAWLGIVNSVGTLIFVWLFGIWGVVIVYIIRQPVAALLGIIASSKR